MLPTRHTYLMLYINNELITKVPRSNTECWSSISVRHRLPKHLNMDSRRQAYGKEGPVRDGLDVNEVAIVSVVSMCDRILISRAKHLRYLDTVPLR